MIPSGRWIGFFSACLLALGSSGAEVVWQIGQFDQSSAEFQQWIHPVTGERQIDYSDSAEETAFQVGTSNPERHWRAYQPGSANGGTGFREHPASVVFDLADAPRENLTLRLGLLAYSARLPVLQVELNGRRGWFYQQPRLAYTGGDPAVFFQPHYSTSELHCELPAAWFQTGSNRLVLTALDQPGEREDVRPSGFPFPGNSGLVYDALALERNPPGQPLTSAVAVRIEPTVFFRERDGRLLEEVEVFVRFRDRMKDGKVTLEIGGETISGAWLADGREFGEVRVTLSVPAWEGSLPAVVRIESSDGQQEESMSLRAARRWRIWVVPHEHLDVGYTDYDAKVAELHSRVVDDALGLAERHPGFSFTVDGFWVIEEYLAGRGEASKRVLIEALRNRKLQVPVVHGSLFTGSASLEGLIRALYPSRRFAREHGTPFEVAIVTDVPSYSWSWASVLAASGVKYFVGASDAYRGPFLLHNRLNEQSPHRWQGPDGGEVTTWYSRHYHQFSSLFGLPPRMTLGRDSLPRFLQAYTGPAYRSDEVILYGTQVENVVLEPAQATFVAEWNREYAYPRLQFGGFATALDSIARQQGELPVVRGDGGPYWEDGLAANARVTALARENSRRLPSAEKAATLASLLNPRFQPNPAELEGAWHRGRLIDEHTWHADCSVRDPDSDQAQRQGEAKDARAFEARRSVDRILQRSLSAISEVVPTGPGALLVFNPLSWERGGLVEVEIGRGQGLVDAETGESLPHEILRTGRVYQRIRFLAPPVPALGYRVFRLRPLTASPRVSPSDETVLESPFYRAILDPERGGLRSLVDLESGAELVAIGHPHALGQWVYVSGGDTLPNRLVQYSTVTPIPELTAHSAGAGKLESSERTALGARARMWTQASNCPSIETEVFLPAGRREVRITLRVRKTATQAKEAAYVAFPLSLTPPKFGFATQNGWVDPARDILPGGCLEWFPVQDWVGIEGDARSVLISPLDAPLVTLGDVVRGTWPREFGSRPATIYSYVMSNYTPEGYAASQGGDFVFRYVITSGAKFDAARAARFGAESLTPLEVNEITRSDKRTAGSGSLDPVKEPGLVVSPATTHVSAWKQADDGRGWILRLLETSGRDSTATVAVPRGAIRSGFRCTAVEDDLGALPVERGSVRVDLKAYGLATLRLELEPSVQP